MEAYTIIQTCLRVVSHLRNDVAPVVPLMLSVWRTKARVELSVGG
jgi:hypothetical protein